MKNELEKMQIESESDLNYLVHRFCNGPEFAFAFVFDNDDLYNSFLSL